MQQDPYLHAAPNPVQPPPAEPLRGDGDVGRNIFNIVGERGGWYPRWWIIATFCCSMFVTIIVLLWHPLICPDQQINASQPIVCGFTQWADFWQIALIWLLMLLLWLLALIFGMGAVEIPARQRSRFGELLRAISEFGPIHILLAFQGLAALPLLLGTWWFNRSTPLSFAFLSMTVFLSHCSYFQRITPLDRRNWLIGYGVLAVALFFIEFFFKPDFRTHLPSTNEWPLLVVQILLVIVAIIAIFRRPQPAPNLSAQEQLQQNVPRTTEPFYVLRSIWPFNRLFPPPPIGGGN
jgi:hypothetical protein